MATATVYAEAQALGYAYGVDYGGPFAPCSGPGTWAAANGTCDSTVNDDMRVGGYKNVDTCYDGSTNDASDFWSYRTSLKFDLSGIPPGSAVKNIVLSLYGKADWSIVDFTFAVASATANFADDGCSAWAANVTDVATHDTSSGWTTGGFNTMTNLAAFAGQITANLGGVMELHLRKTDGAPTNLEYVTFENPTSTPATDPKLVFDYEPPVGLMMGAFF